MKKTVIFLTVLLLSTSTFAANVVLSCGDTGSGIVTVSYTVDVNLVRAFALDISVDSGAVITAVSVLEADYRIYPGQIVIVDGNVTDYNTPVASGLGTGDVTVEMASLWTIDSNYSGDADAGYNAIPPGGGPNVLLLVTVSGNCTLTVSENAARGGVVMENPDEPVSFIGTSCLVGGGCDIYGGPDQAAFEAAGCPACWMNPRQCHGDIDGATEQIGKLTFHVGFTDLTQFVAAWQDAVLDQCANVDHATEQIGKLTFNVGFNDLNKFVANWQDALGTPADCGTGSPANP